MELGDVKVATYEHMFLSFFLAKHSLSGRIWQGEPTELNNWICPASRGGLKLTEMALPQTS